MSFEFKLLLWALLMLLWRKRLLLVLLILFIIRWILIFGFQFNKMILWLEKMLWLIFLWFEFRLILNLMLWFWRMMRTSIRFPFMLWTDLAINLNWPVSTLVMVPFIPQTGVKLLPNLIEVRIINITFIYQSISSFNKRWNILFMIFNTTIGCFVFSNWLEFQYNSIILFCLLNRIRRL